MSAIKNDTSFLENTIIRALPGLWIAVKNIDEIILAYPRIPNAATSATWKNIPA